jgi:hypothetical protein
MTETLEYIRKNRGQIARDVSTLLSVKHVSGIRIARRGKDILVYADRAPVVP